MTPEPIPRVIPLRETDLLAEGAVSAIMDAMLRLSASVSLLGEAVSSLDKLDDLRRDAIAALTDRVANLEASRKV